jgi:hypothetical protein
MLDHSKAALALIQEDLKKWTKVFKIVFSIFSLLYLSYSFLVKNGNFYVNIILISLYSIYTFFELLTYKKDMKKVKKIIARSYKWSTLFLKAFTLGTLLYGIYVGTRNVDGISMILTTLMIILWTLQVLLEILVTIIEPRIKLFTAGIMADLKPVANVINFVKKDTFNVDLEGYKKELEILDKKVVEMKPPKDKKKFMLINRIKLPIFNKKQDQIEEAKIDIVRKSKKQELKQLKKEELKQLKNDNLRLENKEEVKQLVRNK